MPSTPLLQVEALSKRYPGQASPAIDGIGFTLEAGQVYAIVGPSGCGKTTALRTIMGFERADAGRVLKRTTVCADTQHNIHLPPEARGIGVVFQDYALFPHLNVLQNVMFGVHDQPRKQRKRIAQEALARVNLTDVESRSVQALSGGQQQRVAIARALAPGSQIVLLDEPFSNLDADLRRAMRTEVRKLADDSNLGIVLVTHDQEEALSTADQIAVMRNGKVCQAGPPEKVYARPKTAFVAGFVGQTNLVEGQAKSDIAETPLGKVVLHGKHHGPVLLSIRPEHLALRPSLGSSSGLSTAGVSARILAREFKGHDLTYRVRTQSGEYLVMSGVDSTLQIDHTAQLIPSMPASVVTDDR